MHTVSHVLVNILTVPKGGKTQMIVRCTPEQHDMIVQAAALIGMSLNEFMRTTTVQCAEAVIKECTP